LKKKLGEVEEEAAKNKAAMDKSAALQAASHERVVALHLAAVRTAESRRDELEVSPPFSQVDSFTVSAIVDVVLFHVSFLFYFLNPCVSTLLLILACAQLELVTVRQEVMQLQEQLTTLSAETAEMHTELARVVQAHKVDQAVKLQALGAARDHIKAMEARLVELQALASSLHAHKASVERSCEATVAALRREVERAQLVAAQADEAASEQRGHVERLVAAQRQQEQLAALEAQVSSPLVLFE